MIFWILVPRENLIQQSNRSPFTTVSITSQYAKLMNEHAFQTKNVRKFIKNTKNRFDVIVNDEYFSESLLMFAHKYKAPIVTVGKLIFV